jgi:hypothetical protein
MPGFLYAHVSVRRLIANCGTIHEPTTTGPSGVLLRNLSDTGYSAAMTSKEIALKTIEQLPENASWEDIQERINFIVGVRKGLRELDEGKGIPHDRIREECAEWLTD